MIEKLLAATSNPALRYPILPRASETGPLGVDPTGYQKIRDIFAEFCVTIKHRVAIGTVFRECLPSCCTIQEPVGFSVTLK